MTAMADLLQKSKSNGFDKQKAANDIVKTELERFQAHLIEYRKTRDLSYEDMAKRLDIKVNATERIIRQGMKPSAEVMIKIAHLTDYKFFVPTETTIIKDRS